MLALVILFYLLLFSTEERKSNRFGTTWQWVNNDKICILHVNSSTSQLQKAKQHERNRQFVLSMWPPCLSWPQFFTHVLTVIHCHSLFPVCSDTQLVVGGSEHMCAGTKQEAVSGWMEFSTHPDVIFFEVIVRLLAPLDYLEEHM